MVAFLLCILAIVVTGGGFANGVSYGITIIYLIIATLFASYVYYFAKKKESLSLGAAEKCLIVFETWGLLYVLLSYLGVNQIFNADLAYERSFIPRQAVYFFVFPATILFREDSYVKGIDRILNRYGEILFWVLYAAQILYFNEVMLTVMTQALLCWLSLKLQTNQRWRRWIRIIALMITPLYEYGEYTILILRIIFIVICVIPKHYSRIFLCLMAVVILLVIIGCFVLPQVMNEKDTFDGNMGWRLRIWKEEEKILSNTHYLGAGYGTSYPSKTYAREAVLRREGQFLADDGYSEYERMFVTAPHNSFVSLTMRTGVVGLLLFLSWLGFLFRNLVRHKALPPKSACYALFAGVVMILFNVGIENPGYLLSFVFCVGMSTLEGKKLEQKNNME